MSKVLVGISGGLDSAFALSSLVEAGHKVHAVMLNMHGYENTEDAARIAADFGVGFDVLDCRTRFESEVVDYFVKEYANGRTPNPCVKCNRTVKIAMLCEYARENGFDLVATGHYANTCYDPVTDRYSIAVGKDAKKDQSYFLWQLTQDQIAMLTFPLGDMHKSDVRECARARGYEVAERPESQEICFIPDDDHCAFIEARIGAFPKGSFVDTKGKVIGTHKGIIYYTIGQRKGLGMSFGEHMFVKSINAVTNEITLCRKGGEFSDSLEIDELNFVGLSPISEGELELFVKLRYAAPPVPARVRFEGGTATVELASPARAVTPGQSAVFYRDGAVMLGGIIKKA